jgi:hypothetical protein
MLYLPARVVNGPHGEFTLVFLPRIYPLFDSSDGNKNPAEIQEVIKIGTYQGRTSTPSMGMQMAKSNGKNKVHMVIRSIMPRTHTLTKTVHGNVIFGAILERVTFYVTVSPRKRGTRDANEGVSESGM